MSMWMRVLLALVALSIFAVVLMMILGYAMMAGIAVLIVMAVKKKRAGAAAAPEPKRPAESSRDRVRFQ